MLLFHFHNGLTLHYYYETFSACRCFYASARYTILIQFMKLFNVQGKKKRLLFYSFGLIQKLAGKHTPNKKKTKQERDDMNQIAKHWISMEENHCKRYLVGSMTNNEKWKKSKSFFLLLFSGATRHKECKGYLYIRSHPWDAHSKIGNDSFNNFDTLKIKLKQKKTVLISFVFTHVLHLLIWFLSSF